jgi:poly(A) polymerase
MKLVKSWDKYDEKSMGIVVQYLKRCFSFLVCVQIRFLTLTGSSMLPNDVFDQGEVRTRTSKRGKSSSTVSTSKFPNQCT